VQVGPLDRYVQKGASAPVAASPPAKRKRPASPPHEYVLADNADIAVSCEGIIDDIRRCLLTTRFAVHRDVPCTLQRLLPKIASSLWPTRY
jgi:hypothetical protein